jgi:hypothetical protein
MTVSRQTNVTTLHGWSWTMSTILRSSSRFFIKIVRSSRGTQIGFYVAAVLYCRFDLWNQRWKKQQSFTMGASVYCHFFGYQQWTRGAESFSYYRSMAPWIHSTKKIRRKRSSRNNHFRRFQCKMASCGVFFFTPCYQDSVLAFGSNNSYSLPPTTLRNCSPLP